MTWTRIMASRAPWREVIGTHDSGDPIYGPEYLPRSCATGNPVAYETANRAYHEHHGAVGSDGLWDHEIDPGPPPPRRKLYDEVMRALSRWPRDFSERHREIIEWHWERGHSELVIAVQLALSPGRVHGIIVEVRRKAEMLTEAR
jgi:hypothetical protein